MNRVKNRHLGRFWLFWPLGWVLFCISTSTYADNVGHSLSFATFILAGTISSACILISATHGWYRLLFLPIWAFLIVELLVLFINLAR